MKLNEFDKVEWLDLARRMKPGLTDDAYDEMWEGFAQAKKDHEKLRSMN